MNVDSRKGELADLKSQMRQVAGSRAIGVEETKRDLFKKVVHYMTIGLDVSDLFVEIIMCASNASDLVLKKMCYLYLCNYAAVNPEVAVMTVNFLLKDCKDDDATIRGLALRSLCSLRVMNLVEYVVGPINGGLADQNAYVRAVAVMGVLKLYRVAPAVVFDNELMTAIRRLLLSDSDAQVVANCVSVLREVSDAEAGTENPRITEGSVFSKAEIYQLLNRIRELTEWSQCLILDAVCQYRATNLSETYDIMNLLEDRLQFSNSSLVLATVKFFIHLTTEIPDICFQVYERVKAPLLTLVNTGSSPEISYGVLCHLHVLVARAPHLFVADYKHFFCRYSDSSHSKKLKLEMLTAIATTNNAYDIVTELSEYAANVDMATGRESIRAVGVIALQHYDVNGIVDRLLQFLEMDTDYITAEILVLVKDLLRKYPEWSQDCLAVIGGVIGRNIEDVRAKAALVWLLGAYGHQLGDGPEVLESLVASWADEQQVGVKMEMLTAAMKLFFTEPGLCQRLLASALRQGMADQNQDVRDKAMLYYRLLRSNCVRAEAVITAAKGAMSESVGKKDANVRGWTLEEFNSLAIIYGKPSYTFSRKERYLWNRETGAQQQYGFQAVTSNMALASVSEGEDSRKELLSRGGNALEEDVSTSGFPPPPEGKLLLDIDAEEGEPTGVLSSLAGSHVGTVPRSEEAALSLVPSPILDAKVFQKKWTALDTFEKFEQAVPPTWTDPAMAPTLLLQALHARNIQCIASGGHPPKYKSFLFAQEAKSSHYIYLEVLLDTERMRMYVTLKMDDVELGDGFVRMYKSISFTEQ